MSIQEQILVAAKDLCDNAINLPGEEFAQVDEQYVTRLGQILYQLLEQELEQYGHYKNAAYIALERLEMNDQQIAIERSVDMADQLLLTAFDKVVTPGVHIISKRECEGMMIVSQLAIANFLESL